MNETDREKFAANKLNEIHKAVQAVTELLGPEDPFSVAMAAGWDFMRAGIRRALLDRPS